MRSHLRASWFVVPLWAVLVGISLYMRPLMPVDETRYVAVAWEMRHGGNYLVPHLNGEVYSHKPPLLFWLINAGWAVFGVHEWIARMVGPLFGLLDLFALTALARVLWPEDETTRTRAGAMLLAFPFFALYSTLLMFDAMLMFFVLLALIGIAQAAQAQTGIGWRSVVWVTVGVGGGILAKGPIVLLYLLPLTAIAPWWSTSVRTAWRPFAVRLTLGTMGGICAGLAWVIPAAMLGGPEYREAILWTQTAGRMTDSFAHERPITFYFMFLPLLLFPWLYWSPMRAVFRRAAWKDEGLRFCAAWSLGGFLLLCFISGKQVHYMLPLLPGVALIATRTLSAQHAVVRRPALVVAIYALLGISALVAAISPVAIGNLTLSPSLLPILGAVALVAGGLTFVDRRPRAHAVVWGAATASVVLVSAIHAFVGPGLRKVQDTTLIGQKLAALEATDKPVIHVGRYHGQFTFAGRLTRPIEVAQSDEELAAWCERNPNGYVIKYWQPAENRYTGETEMVAPFRGRVVGVVHAHAPELKNELARRMHAAPVKVGP